MSEKNTINKSNEPITIDILKRDLSNIGVREGMILLTHSSLSSIGWVCGGSVSVILALEEILGQDGTLVMPSHSGQFSDPKDWENPPVPESWWNTIRNTMPPYAPDLTPSSGIGVVPEVFRKQKGVLRSSHPIVSFAARGKYARYITANHSLEFSCGEKSPLRKIYDMGGYVLLLGVKHSSNTSIHLAENRAEYPKKKIINCGAPILINKESKWMEYKDYKFYTDDFVKIGNDFTKNRRNLTRTGLIGKAKSQFFKQKDIVDYAVEWIGENRK